MNASSFFLFIRLQDSDHDTSSADASMIECNKFCNPWVACLNPGNLVATFNQGPCNPFYIRAAWSVASSMCTAQDNTLECRSADLHVYKYSCCVPPTSATSEGVSVTAAIALIMRQQGLWLRSASMRSRTAVLKNCRYGWPVHWGSGYRSVAKRNVRDFSKDDA